MDFKIEIDGVGADMTFEEADSILNNIYLSLVVPRGSWFHNPDFGSRLHLLERAKNTERTATLARQYCKEALKWIEDIGRAVNIDVFSEQDRIQDPHRLKLLVRAEQTDGRIVSFNKFLEVV